MSIPENTTATVYTATATAASAISYTLTGTDAKVFSLNATTGALTFLVAPDFETPKDADLNNKYEVTINATAAGATSTLAVTVTVTNVSTPGLVFVFPTAGADLGVKDALSEFTASVRFEDTESHTALAVTDVVVSNQNSDTFTIEQTGYVNGSNGLWVKKGVILSGANTLTASATYMGKSYTATQLVNNGTVVKPEAFALSVKGNKLTVFNGLYNALDTISTISKDVTEQVLPEAATPISPFMAEYESEQSEGWGYTLAKTNSGKFYVVRASSKFDTLTYVQIVNGAGTLDDFVKGVTSLALDENEGVGVPLGANDRLLVLQHENGAAWVSSLNVSNKLITDKSPAPIFGAAIPSLYTTIWTQPAGITNADKIAFDAITKTLVVLDKKAGSSDVLLYGLNAAGTSYDALKFKVTIGGNNARLVTGKGKIYVSEGTAIANNLAINSIDAATGTKTVIYDAMTGTGPTLSAVTDMRINRVNGNLYVLDGVANSFISINTATKTRSLFKSFAVAAGPSFLPNDIAFDGFANFFVSDSSTGGIIGVDAASGKRTVLRSGLISSGQNSIAQQIKYNDTNGLVTAETLSDAAGNVTAKALTKTDVISGMSNLLAPYSPAFDVDHLGVYFDPTFGNFAVSIDGSNITVTNLATSVSKVYAPTTNYGFTPEAVTAVELDQKTGVLYAINNLTKQLYSVDLKVKDAAPKALATLSSVTKPTDIAIDGTNIYYLDSGVLYQVNLAAGGTLSTVSAAGIPVLAYVDGYTPHGIIALGDHMDIDHRSKLAWVSNKKGGALIAVSLITGDRVVVSH